MREKDQRSESGSEIDDASLPSTATSSSSSLSGDSVRENARNRSSSKRRRSISRTLGKEDSGSLSSSSGSSDAGTKRRKLRVSRAKERRSSHKGEKSDREKEKRRERKRRARASDEKHGRKEKDRRKEKHVKGRKRNKVPSVDSGVSKEDVPVQLQAKSPLQVMNEVQMQQKEILRRNVEIAKARLASGELQRMKHEQMEMQRLYGTVDWREKKKLRAEKSRLERTIAAGQKLARIEERETARMDAFRVAVILSGPVLLLTLNYSVK